MAFNSQLTSIANGGPIGTYWKVNEDRDFQAQPENIAGTGVCDDHDNDQVYQLGTSQDSIVKDLLSKGLLFNTTPFSEASADNGSFDHFGLLTGSQVDGSLQRFDVPAWVQLEALFDDAKTMKNFECNMDAPAMEYVLSNLSSQSTLSECILTFQGSMYNGTGTTATPDVGMRLAWVLNSVVMVGAGSNCLLSTAPPGSTQRCLAQRAYVPYAMLATFAIITFTLVTPPLDLMFLIVQYLRCPVSKRSSLSATPNSLVDWIAQAAREKLSTNGSASLGEFKAKHLKQWEYGPHGASGQPRLSRKGHEKCTGYGADQSIALMETGRHEGHRPTRKVGYEVVVLVKIELPF